MAGVKGAGGPVPKRSDQRRRKNTPAAGEPTKTPASPKSSASKPASQRPDPSWHPVAKRWFNSLAGSGQSVFYEPSDWATAYVTAEAMSRELSPQPMVVGTGEFAEVQMVSLPPKAASVAAWLKAMTALLSTEGDRRRAAVELQRASLDSDDGGADVSHIDDVRARLRGAG